MADVVYVDQPLGTGFSIANKPDGYALDEKQIGDDMREFLKKFIELYPSLKNK